MKKAKLSVKVLGNTYTNPFYGNCKKVSKVEDELQYDNLKELPMPKHSFECSFKDENNIIYISVDSVYICLGSYNVDGSSEDFSISFIINNYSYELYVYLDEDKVLSTHLRKYYSIEDMFEENEDTNYDELELISYSYGEDKFAKQ